MGRYLPLISTTIAVFFASSCAHRDEEPKTAHKDTIAQYIVSIQYETPKIQRLQQGLKIAEGRFNSTTTPSPEALSKAQQTAYDLEKSVGSLSKDMSISQLIAFNLTASKQLERLWGATTALESDLRALQTSTDPFLSSQVEEIAGAFQDQMAILDRADTRNSNATDVLMASFYNGGQFAVGMFALIAAVIALVGTVVWKAQDKWMKGQFESERFRMRSNTELQLAQAMVSTGWYSFNSFEAVISIVDKRQSDPPKNAAPDWEHKAHELLQVDREQAIAMLDQAIHFSQDGHAVLKRLYKEFSLHLKTRMLREPELQAEHDMIEVVLASSLGNLAYYYAEKLRVDGVSPEEIATAKSLCKQMLNELAPLLDRLAKKRAHYWIEIQDSALFAKLCLEDDWSDARKDHYERESRLISTFHAQIDGGSYNNQLRSQAEELRDLWKDRLERKSKGEL